MNLSTFASNATRSVSVVSGLHFNESSMNVSRILICVLFAVRVPLFLYGQEESAKVVQFFGMVKYEEGSIQKPLSYTTIRVKNQFRGTFTNPKGGFSLAVLEGDTLVFTHVGFASQVYIIPKSESPDKFFSYKEILLKPEITELPEFEVKSLPTRAQFERDFVNMKFSDDLTNIAAKNISYQSISELFFAVPPDGGEGVNAQFQKQAIEFAYFKQSPGIQLLNPFAWVQFMQHLKSGAVKLK